MTRVNSVPTADELHVDDRARAVYRFVTARDEVRIALTASPLRWSYYRRRRSEDASRPLTQVGVELLAWRRAGATEAELRLVEQFLHDLIDDLTAGDAHRSEDELDREAKRCEARENAVSLELRIAEQRRDPAARQLLFEGTGADREEANVLLERARFRERMARQFGSRTGNGDQRLAAPIPVTAPSRAAARAASTSAI